jgi:hypothetical protein
VVGGDPVVVKVPEHGSNKLDHRPIVGEDPGDTGPAFDLLVDPLDRVR